MTPDSRGVVLRHRGSGHLRFDLPLAVAAYGSSAVQEGLLRVDGVYRVDLTGNTRKLSIRFHPEFCTFERLIQALNALIRELGVSNKRPRSTALASTNRTFTPVAVRVDTLIGWIKARIEALRETFLALKILFTRSVAHRPRWAKEFMNDLLMLFLIKLHWQHIITDWLPKPWTHRYEWAATFYLIYLSVQARVPQSG